MKPLSGLVQAALVLLAASAIAPSASADQTPDDFWLDMVTDAHRGAFVYTNRVVVTGIDEPTPVAIVRTDAQDAGYSIGCTATYTNQPGTILNGQSLCVRHRSGYKRSETDLSVGTWTFGSRFVTYALPDHLPAPAGFPVAYNAPLDAWVVAGPVTVEDIGDGLEPPEVEVTPYGLEYQIDCAGAWLRSTARIADQQSVCVRVKSAGTPDTLTSGMLKVGDASWPFASYTGASLAGTPFGFPFLPQIGVRRGFAARAGSLVFGFGSGNAAAVTVRGGFWGQSHVSGTDVPGIMFEGMLWLSHVAPMQFGATTTTTANVGGVTGDFVSRTIDRKVLTSGRLQDFNGDGYADVLWRNEVTGDAKLWLLDDYFPQGQGVQLESALLGAGSGWTPTHVGDLDGDGTSDIVWRNAGTGETALWLMSEGLFLRGAVVVADTAWRVTHVGDFDGDGTSDLVWHHAADGRTILWLSRGVSFHAWSVALQHPDWKVQHTGDFDGDGKADLLWRNRATGETALWLMDGTRYRSGTIVQANGAWNVELVGDLDGDGRDDLIWSGPSGEVAMYLMDGTVRRSGARLPPGTGLPVAIADLHADGKADLLIRTAGGVDRYAMDGLTVIGSSLELDATKTLIRATDYNGDGWSDIAYLDPTATPPGVYLRYTLSRAPPSGPSPQHVQADPAWKLQ